jgi:hypothetical protein
VKRPTAWDVAVVEFADALLDSRARVKELERERDEWKVAAGVAKTLNDGQRGIIEKLGRERDEARPVLEAAGDLESAERSLERAIKDHVTSHVIVDGNRAVVQRCVAALLNVVRAYDAARAAGEEGK